MDLFQFERKISDRKHIIIMNIQDMLKTKISEVFMLKTVIHTILLVWHIPSDLIKCK